MNVRQQAGLHNQANTRLSLAGAKRGLAIGSLVVLIVAVMTAWFGFLGWGLIEFLRSLHGWLQHLWSMF